MYGLSYVHKALRKRSEEPLRVEPVLLRRVWALEPIVLCLYRVAERFLAAIGSMELGRRNESLCA